MSDLSPAIHRASRWRDPAKTLVYCLTFDGTPIEAPEASDISREDLNGDGAVKLTLKDRNRLACDFFTVAESLPGADNGNDQPSDQDQGNDNGDQTPGDVSAAADTASIEFHVATCPSGYDGSDYFGDCGDNGTDNITFSVLGQNPGHTDSATSSVPAPPDLVSH